MAIAVPISGGATLRPFRYLAFTALWASAVASNFGTIVQTMAASWLMMSLTGSTAMVGAVQAAASLPVMVFALLAGALADAFDRRKIMLGALSGAFAAAAALAAIAYFGRITPGVLILFTLLIGIGYALYLPTWQSSIRLQVPMEVVPAAVGLNAAGFNLARSVAPALGGWIIASGGSASAFLVNSLTYAAMVGVVFWWKPPSEAHSRSGEPLLPSIVTGVRYLVGLTVMRAILSYAFLFGLCGSVFWALLAVVARQLLGGGVADYGLCLTAFGIGALAGGVGSTALRRWMGLRKTVLAGCFGLAAAILCVGLSGLLVLTLPSLFLAGGLWMIVLTNINVSVQMLAPAWLTGRALASYQATTFAALAAGSAGWGLIAQALGLRVALTCDAVVLFAGAILLDRYGIRLPAQLPSRAEPVDRTDV